MPRKGGYRGKAGLSWDDVAAAVAVLESDHRCRVRVTIDGGSKGRNGARTLRLGVGAYSLPYLAQGGQERTERDTWPNNQSATCEATVHRLIHQLSERLWEEKERLATPPQLALL